MFLNIRKTENKGFSLIEMVIVVMIIGILTLFAALWLPGSVDQAKVDKTRLLMDQVVKACRAYAFDHGGNYPEKVKNLWPKYLKESPKSPWGDPIEIAFGKRTEIICIIKWGNEKRRLALPVDALGFGTDNKISPAGVGRTAFSIAKTASSNQTGETNIYYVTMDIEFFTLPTAKYPEPGSDFRFFIDNAEITGVNSSAGVPVYISSTSDAPDISLPVVPNPAPDKRIVISSLGGASATGFEYSSNSGSDRITVSIKNCRRSTNFTLQIYRPGDDGIPIYYGEKKILEVAPGSVVPITLTRLVAESTSAK